MPRERPLIEPNNPSNNQPNLLRGIISPCSICKNNIPVDDGDLDGKERNSGIPCPKRILYKAREKYQRTTDTNRKYNWDGPVFNVKLLSTNPVWPGLREHGNAYAYVYVATYEDNVDTNWNPTFDTERIICRGPYLIKSPEKVWHINGHLEQGDPVLVERKNYFIDGQPFQGFIDEAEIWQVARGYMREIDMVLLKSLSANGTL